MLSKEAWLWVKVNLSKNNPATLRQLMPRQATKGEWAEHPRIWDCSVENSSILLSTVPFSTFSSLDSPTCRLRTFQEGVPPSPFSEYWLGVEVA